ncbi:nucleotidyltransferase [Furfurilactobacillus sp. WILCCON 0119]
MRVVGVVTEYNPFHNGHRYHLEQARSLTHADVVVAVMSGNFVQRGEAALLDKWHRANEALHNGADVVVELPFYWAVQPAHLFAEGALRLLSALQAQTMVFGAEHPETDFTALAQVQIDDAAAFKTFDQTYATQFTSQLAEKTGFLLDQPNDILSYGYAVANANLDHPLTLQPLKRQGQGYHDEDLTTATTAFASATALRTALFNQKSQAELAPYVPATTLADLTAADVTPQAGWSAAMWQLLRHTLLMTPIEELGQIYQMAEGLEYRMKEAAERHQTYSDFMDAIKTKRYTYSRLQRVCLYTLLHATAAEMTPPQADYLRLLGFTPTGQAFLNQYKKQFTLPVVNRFDQKLKHATLNLDYRAGMLYEMLTGVPQDFRHDPLRVNP